MARGSLVKKLLIRPEQRLLILNAPPDYITRLGKLPKGVTVAHQPDGQFDFVHLFVRTVADLNRLGPVAISAVKPDGIFWISYPKRSSKVESHITRDVGWHVIEKAGLEGVAQVAVDEVWSALRFRPAERVGRRRQT